MGVYLGRVFLFSALNVPTSSYMVHSYIKGACLAGVSLLSIFAVCLRQR